MVQLQKEEHHTPVAKSRFGGKEKEQSYHSFIRMLFSFFLKKKRAKGEGEKQAKKLPSLAPIFFWFLKENIKGRRFVGFLARNFFRCCLKLK